MTNHTSETLAWIECIRCALEARPLGRIVDAQALTAMRAADLHDGGIAPQGHTELAVTELHGFYNLAEPTDEPDEIERTARLLHQLDPQDRGAFAAWMRRRGRAPSRHDVRRFLARSLAARLIRRATAKRRGKGPMGMASPPAHLIERHTTHPAPRVDEQ